MNLNHWFARANFLALTLPEKLDLLLARRETLLHQQDEVRERLAALACQQHGLRERQTTCELQWHLFWRRLRQDADAPHSEETETVLVADHRPESPLSPAGSVE